MKLQIVRSLFSGPWFLNPIVNTFLYNQTFSGPQNSHFCVTSIPIYHFQILVIQAQLQKAKKLCSMLHVAED